MQEVDSSEYICHGCIKKLDVGEEYWQCMVETCGKLYHGLCTNKMPTFEDRNTWVCPECCNLVKKDGRNNDIPVGTPVTTRNITIRSKRECKPSTECPGESTILLMEMQSIRDQMTMLNERLIDAVSAVAGYHAALADCSIKLELVSERLGLLELSSPCSCRCAVPGPVVTGNTKGKTTKKRQEVELTAPRTDKPVTSVDIGTSKKVTYADVAAGSPSDFSNLQDNVNPVVVPVAGEWQEVRNHRKRISSVRCTAGPDVTTLKAVEYRKYIHLWNMASGVDEIRAYMQILGPGKTCTVEELKSKGEYKSYKIGVPQELYDKCLSAEVWPKNARVKAWLFRKLQNNTSVHTERQA